MNNLSPAALAKMIDHSLLHPTLTDAEMAAGCALANAYSVAAACVKPCFVEPAAGILRDSTVAVCSVVAFPHGNSPVRIKLAEIEEMMARGATEIDLVVNIGKVLGEDWDYLATEIAAARELTAGQRGILKIIFENDYLQDRHIIKLCEICSAHRVDFVKTSTGYGFVKQANGMYAYHGATDRHLRLMRAASGRWRICCACAAWVSREWVPPSRRRFSPQPSAAPWPEPAAAAQKTNCISVREF